MSFPAAGEYAKLGKGALFLDKLTTAGASTGFDFKQNVTALTLAADVTKVEQYSSTEASSPLIASAVTRVGYTLTATLAAYTLENLKAFLLGTSTVINQPAVANATKLFAGLSAKGKYFDLGAREVTNVRCEGDTTELLVAGVDFIAESDSGLVQILPGARVADGSDLLFTFDAPALVIDSVAIANDAAPVCHLLYLADDANQDGDSAKDRLEVWKAQTAPTGDLGLISDDYGTFQLTLSVLSDSNNHPNNPFGTLNRVRR
jgi:hypothetical protein